MAVLTFGDHGIRTGAPGGPGRTPGRIIPSPASRVRALAARFAAVVAGVALTGAAVQLSEAAEPGRLRIAVFDFELDDRSAGGGIIDQDEMDSESLKKATEEARRLLAASGRYKIVDAGRAADDVVSAGGIRHCNGCEGPLARTLGADRSMAGIITRVTRTEYTLQILVRDTQTGALLTNDFTGLRMGANYSWPRGVRWLMNKGLLAEMPAQ